ncbi:MAG: hypothetical protein WKF59_17420 [Chitinophagaceae bacterium]
MKKQVYSIKELVYVPLNSSANVPLDIDSHYIPANKNKNEQEHVHHDFRYLFVYNGDKNITIPHIRSQRCKMGIFFSFSRNRNFFYCSKKD